MSNKTSTFFKGMSGQTLITVVMGVLEIVEFALYPRLVSKEYITTVYPMVEKVRARLGLK